MVGSARTHTAMTCIFCKADSAASPVAVPMLPASFGITDNLVPPGAVCEQCQEYFVREVDRPFVETAGPALRRCTTRDDDPMLASPGPLVSRFMAKLALEVMGLRLPEGVGGIAYLAGETQFDPIRHHARYGTDREWPVHVRRIYHPVGITIADDGEIAQVVHECDILHTAQGEYYFVSVLFGVEFAINYGGPVVDGYEAWLRENDQASPLYSGPNARPLPVLSRSNERPADN